MIVFSLAGDGSPQYLRACQFHLAAGAACSAFARQCHPWVWLYAAFSMKN